MANNKDRLFVPTVFLGIVLSIVFIVAFTRGLEPLLLQIASIVGVAYLVWVVIIRKSVRLLVATVALLCLSFFYNSGSQAEIMTQGTDTIKRMGETLDPRFIRFSLTVLSVIPWITMMVIVPSSRRKVVSPMQKGG